MQSVIITASMMKNQVEKFSGLLAMVLAEAIA
jgi:hypothetical protein